MDGLQRKSENEMDENWEYPHDLGNFHIVKGCGL